MSRGVDSEGGGGEGKRPKEGFVGVGRWEKIAVGGGGEGGRAG